MKKNDRRKNSAPPSGRALTAISAGALRFPFGPWRLRSRVRCARRLPGGLPCPLGAPAARIVGRWRCPCAHGVSLGSPRCTPDAPLWGGETVLLPTYHQTITRARLPTPARSSRGSSTAFRPALQGQRRSAPSRPGRRTRGSSLPSVVRAPAPVRPPPRHVPGSRCPHCARADEIVNT